MHYCLKIPEILSQIIELSTKLHLTYRSRRDQTYKLALVCKTFLEPALNELWKDQELLQLLKCFPSDLWEVLPAKGRGPQYGKYVFKRPLKPDDWKRFEYYSCRVVSLDLESRSPDIVAIDPNIFQAIHMARELLNRCSSPLLSNLSTLTWTHRETVEYTISPWDIRLFLGPRVININLSLMPGSVLDELTWPRYATALDMVGSKCSEVKSLSLDMPEYPLTILPHLTSLCRGMTTLREFYCITSTSYLPAEAFGYLASMPYLRVLHCEVLEDDLLRSIIPLLPSHPFQALEEVQLTSAGIEYATVLFNTLNNAILKKITIVVDEPPSPSNLQEFFLVVTLHCIPALVTDITIEQSDYGKDVLAGIPAEHCLESHSIRPLFGLPNIRNFHIKASLSMEKVTDSLIQDMISAWPILCSLDLIPWQWLGPSKLSLEGLAAFAKCSKMTSLSITFDSLSTPGLWHEGRPGKGFSCRTLTQLDLGRSTIQDPQLVAAILSDVFPEIPKFNAWEDCDEADEEQSNQRKLWECVRQNFKGFVRVRGQERISAINI